MKLTKNETSILIELRKHEERRHSPKKRLA